MEQILNGHFNKKKIQIVNFFSHLIHIIQKVSYDVQLQIDKQLDEAKQQFKNIPKELIKDICAKMQRDKTGFYEKIIDNLHNFLKKHALPVYSKKDCNVKPSRYQSQENSPQYGIEYTESKIVDNGMQHQPQNLKNKAEKAQTKHQNFTLSKDNLIYQSNQDSNKNQSANSQVHPNLRKVISGQNPAYQMVGKGISKDKYLESSRIPQQRQEKSQVIEKSGYDQNRVSKQFHQIDFESNQPRNSAYFSPSKATQAKSKQKVQVLKKPQVCQSFDKMFNKQAKDMLLKSQQKKYSYYSSLKRSRSTSKNDSTPKLQKNESVNGSKKGINLSKNQKFDKLMQEKLESGMKNYSGQKQDRYVTPVRFFNL